MKVLLVFGTRPEAIKLAPVIRELNARPEFDCKICVTGQHREMLAQVLQLFNLQPDWDLELMRPDQDLAYITGAALSGVSEILAGFRPNRVIVQGVGRILSSNPGGACRSRSTHREHLFAMAGGNKTVGWSRTSPICISPRRRGPATICGVRGWGATAFW